MKRSVFHKLMIGTVILFPVVGSSQEDSGSNPIMGQLVNVLASGLLSDDKEEQQPTAPRYLSAPETTAPPRQAVQQTPQQSFPQGRPQPQTPQQSTQLTIPQFQGNPSNIFKPVVAQQGQQQSAPSTQSPQQPMIPPMQMRPPMTTDVQQIPYLFDPYTGTPLPFFFHPYTKQLMPNPLTSRSMGTPMNPVFNQGMNREMDPMINPQMPPQRQGLFQGQFPPGAPGLRGGRRPQMDPRLQQGSPGGQPGGQQGMALPPYMMPPQMGPAQNRPLQMDPRLQQGRPGMQPGVRPGMQQRMTPPPQVRPPQMGPPQMDPRRQQARPGMQPGRPGMQQSMTPPPQVRPPQMRQPQTRPDQMDPRRQQAKPGLQPGGRSRGQQRGQQRMTPPPQIRPPQNRSQAFMPAKNILQEKTEPTFLGSFGATYPQPQALIQTISNDFSHVKSQVMKMNEDMRHYQLRNRTDFRRQYFERKNWEQLMDALAQEINVVQAKLAERKQWSVTATKSGATHEILKNVRWEAEYSTPPDAPEIQGNSDQKNDYKTLLKRQQKVLYHLKHMDNNLRLLDHYMKREKMQDMQIKEGRLGRLMGKIPATAQKMMPKDLMRPGSAGAPEEKNLAAPTQISLSKAPISV